MEYVSTHRCRNGGGGGGGGGGNAPFRTSYIAGFVATVVKITMQN